MLNIPEDRPVYRVLNVAGFFGPDSHLYPEGKIIAFMDEPNEEFEPMNKLARDAMEKYLNKLDKLGEAVAKKNGRQFAGRPRSLDGVIAVASEDMRRVSLVQGDGGVPLMGAQKTNTGIEMIEVIKTPQTSIGQNKKDGKGTLSLSAVANNATPII